MTGRSIGTDILFLAHRIPYPPDKGEKIRSFHMLRHLSRSYRVHLGCLTVEPGEQAHLATLRQWCASAAGFPIDRRVQKLRALARVRPGQPLMPGYYRSEPLHDWVAQARRAHPIALDLISTVAMMPYAATGAPAVLDAMDIDSEKWAAYAQTAPWWTRPVWAREARTLLAYECAAAGRAAATLFVSPAERARFAQLAPAAAARVHAIENGVDLERFSPAHSFPSPFATPGPHIVFTGHMDYWPNADAVTDFATGAMPRIRAAWPEACFHIVGANPGPGVLRLAALPGVAVTGRVPDPRPFIAHANACVAPLRIARGIQNKVLEAMAMGRPVIASPPAFEGVRATPGRDLLVADGAAAMAEAVGRVVSGVHPGLGNAARAAMEAGYSWDTTLAPLDNIVAAAQSEG